MATTFVVFASFEVEADSEDDALSMVGNNFHYDYCNEIWVQGVMDEDGSYHV